MLKDVPIDKSGQGSGTASTARQIGSALGIAILGTVLFTSAGSALDTRLSDVAPALPPAARSQIVNTFVASAGGVIPGLTAKTPKIGKAAGVAFSDGTRYTAFAASGFLVIGLLATLRLSGAGGQDGGSSEGRPAEAIPGASRGSERKESSESSNTEQ